MSKDNRRSKREKRVERLLFEGDRMQVMKDAGYDLTKNTFKATNTLFIVLMVIFLVIFAVTLFSGAYIAAGIMAFFFIVSVRMSMAMKVLIKVLVRNKHRFD